MADVIRRNRHVTEGTRMRVFGINVICLLVALTTATANAQTAADELRAAERERLRALVDDE